MTKAVNSEIQQLLDRVGEAVDELEAATPDAEILLDGLYADRGLTLLKTETLTAMEAGRGKDEFLAKIFEMLADHVKVNGEGFGWAGVTDPGAFLDSLERHGLTLVGMETPTAMEAATREATAGAPGGEPMWCVFEQMGHARYPCRLTVVELAGQPAYRLDVPDGDGWVTTYVRPGTMYAIRPCSEDVVRRVAAHTGAPEPAHPWELKAIEPTAATTATGAARDAWRGDPEDDYGDDG